MEISNQSLFKTRQEQDEFVLERLQVIERYLKKRLKHNPELINYDSREEVMQEVAVKILQTLPRLQPGKGSKAYLTEVGKNRIRDITSEQRKEEQKHPISLDQLVGRHPENTDEEDTYADIIGWLLHGTEALKHIQGDDTTPWIIQEGQAWKVRELYSALHRLPLVEQVELKALYNLAWFNPSPVQAFKNNGTIKRGSNSQSRKDHAMKLLRADEQLQQALLA